MNGQLWGTFYQTNTQTDQARPKKQQGRNLTGQARPSKAASNGPIAGSLASQQDCQKLSKTCFTAVRGLSPWSAKLHLGAGPRTQHAQLFAKQNFRGIPHRTCGFCSAAVLVSSRENTKKKQKLTALGNHESTADLQSGG